MKKRVLLWLLTLVLCLQWVPVSASAATATSGTYQNLTWSLASDGTLTISGSGEIPSSSSAPWNSHKGSVQKLVLSSGITSIAYSAFSDYSALERVTLPDTLKTIKTYAFERCTTLRSVHLPSSVSGIWEGAFRSCSGLYSITLPKDVNILSDAFQYCSNLKSIAYMGTKAEWKDSALGSHFPAGAIVHYNACSDGHTFGTYYADAPDRYGAVKTAVCTKCDATNTVPGTYDDHTFDVWTDSHGTSTGASISQGMLKRAGTSNGAVFTLEHIKDNQYYIHQGSSYLCTANGAPTSNNDTYNGKYYLKATSKSSATVWTIKDDRFCTTINGTEYMIYAIMNYSPASGYHDFRLTTEPAENYPSYIISVSSTVTTPPHTHSSGTAAREEVIEATYLTDGSYDEVTRCTVCGQVLSRKEVTVPATGTDTMAGIEAACDGTTGSVTLENVPNDLTVILAAYSGDQMTAAYAPTSEDGTVTLNLPQTLTFDSLQFFLLTKRDWIPVAGSRSIPLETASLS